MNGPAAVGVDGVGDVYVLDAYQVMWIERPAGSGQYTQEQLIPLDSHQLSSQPGFPIVIDNAGNVWAVPIRLTGQLLLEYQQGTPPSADYEAQYGVLATGPTWGVTNLGNEPLNLAQISFSADYSQEPGTVEAVYFPPDVTPVGDCKAGETLTGSQYCTLSAKFLPSMPLNGKQSMPVNGDITLVSNAAVSAEQVALSGVEDEPFPAATVLATSANPSVTGQTLTLTVTFTPTAALSGSSGQLSEAVSFTANPLDAAGTKTSIAVTGTETIPSLALSATAVTVTAGAATGNTSTVTLAPGGGFTGSVTLTAAITSQPAGAQDMPTLNITSPVSITGSGAATATLTVSTTAPTTALNNDTNGPGLGAGGAVFAFVVCSGLRWRRRRWLMGLAVLAIVSVATSCGGGGNAGGGGGGGGGNPGTTPGNYTITVTASAGNTSTNCTLTLTVQ